MKEFRQRRVHNDNCARQRKDYPDVKPWVIAAITQEETYAPTLLWKNEPSQETIFNERMKQIRFLRKHATSEPTLGNIADRLEGCQNGSRCLSGACPECGRLFQRWFVRTLKRFIADNLNNPDCELVALSIAPAKPIVRPGNLSKYSVADFQRRLKYALDEADIEIAIGGVDFSFNEDRDGKYLPFWCVHPYVICSIEDAEYIGSVLRRFFKPSKQVPKPILVPPFRNKAWRRSYALKMHFKRRIGFTEIRTDADGKHRRCRNTSTDKLRAIERLELFPYLNQIGLEARVIFRGAKPVIKSSGVQMQKA